jgi:hypothetical protein
MTMFAMAVLMATSILPHHHHGDMICWTPDNCPVCKCEIADHYHESSDCTEHTHDDDHDTGRCVALSPYLAAAHDTRDQNWYVELPSVGDFTFESGFLLVSMMPERIDSHDEIVDEMKASRLFVISQGLRSPPCVL